MFNNSQLTLNGLSELDELNLTTLRVDGDLFVNGNYYKNGHILNTSDIPEDTNLYYTDARVENVVNPILNELITEIDNTYVKKIGDTMTGALLISNIDASSNILNIGNSATTINLGCGSNIQTVNIGSNNSLGTTTINLGGTNDIVNIQGTLTSVLTTNTEVFDKNLVLNKGSVGAQTARGGGFSLRDNNNDNQGYIIVDETDGQGYNFKAPENTGIIRIRPSTGLTSNVLLDNVAQTITADKTFQNSIVKFNNVNGRKVVCWEDGANEHQILGLKVNAGLLGYQVSTTGTDHVWYAGVNSTTSNQLMRLRGNGNLCIGTTTVPTEKLLVEGTARITSNLEVSGQTTIRQRLVNTSIQNRVFVLFDGPNDHQYSGFGVNADTVRYQVPSNVAHHTFYCGVNSTTSNQLMRIRGDGNVIIGSSGTTTEKLLVEGTTRINNSTTLLSSLNVSGFTTLNNNTTIGSSLFVSGNTILQGNLIISGTTNLNFTNFSSLNVSGTSLLNGPITANSSLNVSGFTTLNNSTTILSSLSVSGITQMLTLDAPDIDPTIGDGERELNIGLTNCNVLNLNCGRNGNKVINIGTANTNQSAINIGNLDRNSLVYIEGTIRMKGNITSTDVVHSDLKITNKNIYLNVGGPANSLGGSGIVFQEGGDFPAQLYIGADRNSYRFKAPYYPQECILEFDNGSNFTINKTKIDKIHDALTLGTSNGLSLSGQQLSLAQASTTQTGSLTMTDFSKFNTLDESKWNQLGNNIYNKNVGYNVGINTSVPNYTLDVAGGDVNVAGGYVYRCNGSEVLSNTKLSVLNSDLQSVGQLNSLRSGPITGLSTLFVSGSTTLNNGLFVSGSTTLNNGLFVSGFTTLNNGLFVSGNTVLSGDVNIDSNTVRVDSVNNRVRIGSNNQAINNQFEVYNVNTPNLALNHDNAVFYSLSGNATQLSLIANVPINPTLTKRFAYSSGGVEKLSIDGPTGNLNISNNANYQISGITILNTTSLGSTVVNSSLRNIGLLDSLAVSGFTNLNNSTTIGSSLSVSGNTILQGPVTTFSSLNVLGSLIAEGNTVLQGPITASSSLNISGNTILQGTSTLQGPITSVSSLNVSGNTVLNNTTLIQFNASFPNLLTLKNNSGSSVLNYESLTYNAVAGIAHGSNFYVSGVVAGDYFIRNNSRGIVFGDQFATTMKIDNLNRRAGIGTINPSYPLHVSGDTNLSNNCNYRISGISVLNSNTLGSGVIFSDLQKVGTLNNLNVFGASTMNSNLFVGGNVNLSSTSNYQISTVSVLNYDTLGSTVDKSSLKSVGILNNLTSSGGITGLSTLNINGDSLLNNVTINGNLTVSGSTTTNFAVSNLSSFFVSGVSLFQNSTTMLSTLNVLGNTNITNNLTITGSSLLRNNVTCLSNLNVNAPLFVTGVSSLQDYVQILGTTDSDYNTFIRIKNTNIINNSYRIRNPSNNNLYISRERNGMVTDYIECTYSDNIFLRVPTTSINIFQINAQTYGLDSILRFFNNSQVSQTTWDITVTSANDFIIGKNNALQYYIRCLNTNNIYLERNTTVYANLTIGANNIFYYAPPVGGGVQYLIWNFNTNAIETIGSDERLKKNIKKLKTDESEFIYRIKVFKYQTKDEKTNGNYIIGPVAQQIERDVADAKMVYEFNYKTVDDRSIAYAHLQETQKLKKIVNKQQKRILDLEKQVNKLEDIVNKLINKK